MLLHKDCWYNFSMHGFAGACVTSKDVVVISDAQNDSRLEHELENILGFKIENVVCIPALSTSYDDSTPSGVVMLMNKSEKGKYWVIQITVISLVMNTVLSSFDQSSSPAQPFEFETADIQVMKTMTQKISHELHIQYRDLLHAGFLLKEFSHSPEHKKPSRVEFPSHYTSAGRINSEANRGPSFGYHPEARHSKYHRTKDEQEPDAKAPHSPTQEKHENHYANAGRVDSEANRGPSFGYHPEARHSKYHRTKDEQEPDAKAPHSPTQEKHENHYANAGRVDSESNRGPSFGYHPVHTTLHPHEQAEPNTKEARMELPTTQEHYTNAGRIDSEANSGPSFGPHPH